MTVAARLAALEHRHAPAPPPPITPAQWEKLARRLVRIAQDEGRAGLIRRLTPALGATKAEAVAERLAGSAFRRGARGSST